MDRQAFKWGSAAWLALRVVTLIGTFSLGYLEPGPDVEVPGYRPPALSGLAQEVAEPWLRADALWYLKIATSGYRADDGTLAFFPAFPALTWLLNLVVANEAVAALLAANLASWAGLVLLFAFVSRLVNAQAAAAAVFGVALFPTAFFFVAPYGEAVLLAAGSSALLFALRGSTAATFAAGFVAALSRPFGAAIALPIAAISAKRRGFGRWLAPLGPVAGLAVWAAYAWRLSGDPLALVHSQGNWQRELTPFWQTLVDGFVVWRRWSDTELGSYLLFDLAATLFGLVLIPLVIVAVRRLGAKAAEPARYGLAAYGLAVMAVPLSLPFLPRPLMSNPRFVLALFPLFLGLAVLPRKLRAILAVGSALGLLVASTVYLAGRPLF
jgi:hypothetical protein